MKTSPPTLLFVAVWLSFLTIIHADENKVSGTKDGLELIVSTVTSPDTPQPSIECRLHNTTDQDIPFDLSGQAFRLSFQALDAGGNDIPMTAAGEKEYDWRRTEHMRHSTAAIQPGNDRVFTFHPHRAYGDRWKTAVRLVVSWEPGIDWTWPQKPYTKGRGLSVSYDIPKGEDTAPSEEKSKASPVSKPMPNGSPGNDLNPHKEPSEQTVPIPQGAESTSTTSLSIAVVVVILAVVCFLLRQMLKKRS